MALVGSDGARTIELGAVSTAPTPWGDAGGFIVSGALLMDASGTIALAPGHQVRDARVFRQSYPAGNLPTSDTISLDGSAWMSVDGLVGWAGRDGDGARSSRSSAAPAARSSRWETDLTPRSQRALPSTTRGDGGQSWIAAVSGSHVVWAATVENDPGLRHLGRVGDARPGRRSAPPRRELADDIVSPGNDSVLLGWTESRGAVRYAVAGW